MTDKIKCPMCGKIMKPDYGDVGGTLLAYSCDCHFAVGGGGGCGCVSFNGRPFSYMPPCNLDGYSSFPLHWKIINPQGEIRLYERDKVIPRENWKDHISLKNGQALR